MSDFHSLKWTPITDILDDWKSTLHDTQTDALITAWKEQLDELRERDLYKAFLARLQREWAIETGIIEGVYSLNEGATLTLIEQGLDAAYITHDDTKNESPELVVAKIRDNHHAIIGLQNFLNGQRPFGTSFIKELHCVLTAHQDKYIGRDTLGNYVDRELPKGVWKTLPNDVEHPDGTKFEFCPPEHVAQEMDNLVQSYFRHQTLGISTEVSAAWLHHRFTLIHPFTDGNGRVARCLATLVYLRDHWLPLVVTRRDRASYIEALRYADNGNLRPLIDCFGTLQRRATRQALSLGEEVRKEANRVEAVLQAFRRKHERRRVEAVKHEQKAFDTADHLLEIADNHLREIADRFTETLKQASRSFGARVKHALRDSAQAFYYYNQIIECAKKRGYKANLGAYRSWCNLQIKTGLTCEILVSFHGIGNDPVAIIGASAMFFTRDRNKRQDSDLSDVSPIGDDIFEFAVAEDTHQIHSRFESWIDSIIARGLEQWESVS